MSKTVLRVVHLSGMMSRGGGENHIINLTTELNNMGHESTVFCPLGSQLGTELKELNSPVVEKKLRLKVDPLFFLSFGKFCKKKKIDIIHVHDPVAMFLVILASYFFKLPKTVMSKKTSFPIKNRKKTLYKYNHPIFKRVICVSNEVKKVSQKSIVNSNKIVTIYNGSNLDKLDTFKPKINLRESLNISKDVTLVLHIANHTKPKDLPLFIKCVEYFKDREDVHFVQIGRHTEHSIPILEAVESKRLEKRVSFLHEQENAAVYLKQADISFITSKSEGLPQVIYESMYYQTLIVSTMAGGIPEVISNGVNGFIAPVGDSIKLIEHLNHVIGNKSAFAKMLDQNFQLVKEKYDSKIMAQKTLELYQNLLKPVQ